MAIAEALKVNSGLTFLDLGNNNNIGVDGAKAIAEALKVNAGLTFQGLEAVLRSVRTAENITLFFAQTPARR